MSIETSDYFRVLDTKKEISEQVHFELNDLEESLYSQKKQEKLKEISPKEFLLLYIKSQKYKERLKKSGYENLEEEVNRRYAAVKNINIQYQEGSLSLFDQLYNEIKGIPYNPQGGSSASIHPDYIVIDTDEVKALKTTKEDVITHELAHKALGLKDERLNDFDIAQLTNRLNKSADLNVHDLEANENKADMDALRYELYKRGVDIFNFDIKTTDLEKLKTSQLFTIKRLFKNYKKEDLLWLLNNVADAGDSNSDIENMV
jgi:predicted SprT family Zn-dependent metalloprotease